VGYDFIRDRVTTPELAKLLGFFNTRQGQLGSFFYYDPTDNAVVDQPVATGDGQLATFQLTRTVAAGGPYAFVEPVYVLNGTPTVTVAGAATPSALTGRSPSRRPRRKAPPSPGLAASCSGATSPPTRSPPPSRWRACGAWTA
jgi:hypothetical protein